MRSDEPMMATALSATESPRDATYRDDIEPAAHMYRGLFAVIGRGAASAAEWLFGVFSLIVGLSILATIPVVQFASLGYLLESAGRVARSGRLRDGVIGARRAARVGSVVLGTWILLQPVRWLASMRYSAELLQSERIAGRLELLLAIVSLFLLGQVVWACCRGGRLRSFFWPAPICLWRRLRAGGMYVEARNRLWDFVAAMRLPYYFLKGVRGFGVTFVWLMLPVSIMVLSTRLPEGPAFLLGLVGGLLLATVLLYLPFLQVNFAQHDRFGDAFDVRLVRWQFRRAPVAFWLALLFTLLLALPLYVLKAELIPREAAWLPSIVFVLSIFPARLLSGFAVARAERREQPRLFLFRWMARLAAVPIVLIYVLVVYLTQYTSWYGTWSLYEQHAFLLPVPFLGL